MYTSLSYTNQEVFIGIIGHNWDQYLPQPLQTIPIPMNLEWSWTGPDPSLQKKNTYKKIIINLLDR